jgi:ubiquinone/menaquinone biosynthesis C-methylase UbiE
VGIEEAIKLCNKYLPKKHSFPRFFQVQSEAKEEVGQKEIISAFDRIHEFYDAFWLKEAGRPIMDLVDRLLFTGAEAVLEAGCGTGYATVLIADRLQDPADFIAADISEGMLAEARKRASLKGIENIRFINDDALKILLEGGLFDIIFSSWVLGYIPLKPFFINASRALKEGGRLAFVVHKEDSPHETLEIFSELVSKDPSILQKRVAFDFPRNMYHVRDELVSADLEVEHLIEGKVVFRFARPEEVLDHLLKSGAGTAYYDALDPDRRNSFEEDFKKNLVNRHKTIKKFEVVHDYISCVARKPNASTTTS